MRNLWIFDHDKTEHIELTKFLMWMKQLGFFPFSTVDQYLKELTNKYSLYKGRLAFELQERMYPGCCGVRVPHTPAFHWEFSGSTSTWPRNPVPTIDWQGIYHDLYNADKHVETLGTYSSLEQLKSDVRNYINSAVQNAGCYTIADYADGSGPLFRLYDEMLDRKRFILEPLAAFRNGNTHLKLGLWLARHIDRDGENLKPEMMDVETLAQFRQSTKEEQKARGYFIQANSW